MGGTDAEAEVQILWPSDVKRQLIGKDSDAGKDWRQKEKGTAEDETVVSGERVISSILSHYRKKLKQQMDQCYSLVTAQFKLWTSVTAQLQLSTICKQRKIHPRDVRVGQSKRSEEEKREAQFWFIFLFVFLLLLSLPYVIWANQEGFCFIWDSHSGLICWKLLHILHRLEVHLPVLFWVSPTSLEGLGQLGSSSSLFSSVQFSRSVVSNSLWPHELQHARAPVHHQLPEFTQTHAHRVDDAIQPSHPLLPPSPPVPNPSQHRRLFQWVNSSHEVAKVLEFQLQHKSFQWTPRTDLL